MSKGRKRTDINLIKKVAGISSDLGAALNFVFDKIEPQKKTLEFKNACPCCTEINEIKVDFKLKLLLVGFESVEALNNYSEDNINNIGAIADKYNLKPLMGIPKQD